MPVTRTDELEYSDSTAQATRCLMVDSGGGVVPTPPAPVQRTTTVTRLTGGADLNIPAGRSSYTVTVIAAASSGRGPVCLACPNPANVRLLC